MLGRLPHGTRLLRVADRPLVPAAIALVAYAVLVTATVVAAGGEPSRLVHAAPPWTTEDGKPESLLLVEPDEAFDGQFFYRLGVAPWSEAERVAGVRFDLPAVRNARWLYGAAAYPVSGGDPDLVPWALIGLNLVAATAVGWLGGALARSSGRHALWGLLLPAYPGFAYSLTLDTAELAAGALVLGGLLAARHGRWAVTGGTLALALLTRDTTAVVPAGMLVAAGLGLDGPDGRRRLLARPLAAAAFPLAVFLLWQAVQRQRFGVLPLTSSGSNNLGLPLAALADVLPDLLPPEGAAEAFRLLSTAFLVLALGAAALVWRRSAAPGRERLAWLLASGVVVALSGFVWAGATGFMRAATEAYLLSVLLLLAARPPRLLAGAVGVLWLLTAAAQVAKQAGAA